jgi:hypothetical protein
MAYNAEARKRRIIEHNLTGLQFGCWAVLGPTEPNKTWIWWCQCKCGHREPYTRREIRFRTFNSPAFGCRMCRYSVQLGKGNVPHTSADVSEVCRRMAYLGKGGVKRWAKYRSEGDRQESNRKMNEARLKQWAERVARGESKGHPWMWSQEFKNRVAIIKQQMQQGAAQ